MNMVYVIECVNKFDYVGITSRKTIWPRYIEHVCTENGSYKITKNGGVSRILAIATVRREEMISIESVLKHDVEAREAFIENNAVDLLLPIDIIRFWHRGVFNEMRKRRIIMGECTLGLPQELVLQMQNDRARREGYYHDSTMEIPHLSRIPTSILES